MNRHILAVTAAMLLSGSATADAVSWGATQMYNDENGAAPALRSETVVKTDYDRGRALVPEVKEINRPTAASPRATEFMRGPDGTAEPRYRDENG